MTTKITSENKDFLNLSHFLGPKIDEFEFIIPTDYNHDTWLDTFARKTERSRSTHYLNRDISSRNFPKTTGRLEPGETYRVELVPVIDTIPNEYCVDYLVKQKAILTGPHGLTLLQDQKPNKFPVGKWMVSLDKRETLWFDKKNSARIPRIYRHSANNWEFFLGSFDISSVNGVCLVCFFKL